ncbi:SEC-C metal-binding domain-containing protein [Sporosarcina sp. 179-K 3D1 HS]|uniref:SEC-C metal-binding domain-containing protein n=1 Tax=Sporosarcina sp. 179-K 3D1 HS TaxID=3232169 RepID=UPI0039A27FF3
MVGRNDPCPCGSGKKYKKCCALKKSDPVETLVDEELSRIVSSVFEQPPSHSDIAEFERYRRQWLNRLESLWRREEIEEAISEYFLFIARPDIWKRHLVRTSNSPIREAVRSILDVWKNPFVLFGKVIGEQEGFFVVEEILGNDMHFIDKEMDMPFNELSQEDLLVFGPVLPDNRKIENGIYVISSLTFINDPMELVRKEIISLAEESGFETSSEFYKEHMVDVYEILLDKETATIDAVIENLPPLQRDAINALDEVTGAEIGLPEVQEILKNILVSYFVLQKPNFRKAEILSAAMFQVAFEIGVIPGEYSKSRIAELFGVSVSSMTKHADNIHEYVMDSMKEAQKDRPRLATEIGTDPAMTERPNWEMFCRINESDFETMEETQAYMNRVMNEQFIPKGAKQQAQALAYEAYEAKSDSQRYQLAKQAAELDPQNVDVLLLQAEMAKDEEKKEQYYRTAIAEGEKQFDGDVDIAWNLVTNRPYLRAIFSYGAWLFDEQKFAEAARVLGQLLALNPNDNQGARYVAIASHIHADEAERALELLEEYPEEDDAIYLFLEWIATVKDDPEDRESLLLLSNAHEHNLYVGNALEEPIMPFPRRYMMEAGSVEEARYISKLLNRVDIK